VAAETQSQTVTPYPKLSPAMLSAPDSHSAVAAALDEARVSRTVLTSCFSVWNQSTGTGITRNSSFGEPGPFTAGGGANPIRPPPPPRFLPACTYPSVTAIMPPAQQVPWKWQLETNSRSGTRNTLPGTLAASPVSSQVTDGSPNRYWSANRRCG